MYRMFYADWTKTCWKDYVKDGGFADINYSCQISNGMLLTIG